MVSPLIYKTCISNITTSIVRENFLKHKSMKRHLKISSLKAGDSRLLNTDVSKFKEWPQILFTPPTPVAMVLPVLTSCLGGRVTGGAGLVIGAWRWTSGQRCYPSRLQYVTVQAGWLEDAADRRVYGNRRSSSCLHAFFFVEATESAPKVWDRWVETRWRYLISWYRSMLAEKLAADWTLQRAGWGKVYVVVNSGQLSSTDQTKTTTECNSCCYVKRVLLVVIYQLF